MQTSLCTRVHSRILDCAPICIRVWYAVRALDWRGSGRAEFCVSDLAKSLNVALPTLKRYIRQAVQLGFLRTWKKHNGAIHVYYASLIEVAIRLGLRELGAVTEMDISTLNRSYIRSVATQLDAERCQTSSLHLAKKQTPKSHRRQILHPNHLLAPQKASSHCSRGATVIFMGKRCVFVDDDVITTGVSQKHLAELVGRSRSTIQRRLSNTHRSQHNLPTILKRQVAQKVSDAIAFEIKEQGGRTIIDSNTMRSYFVQSGSAWRSCCNIYLTEFDLNSVRFLRSKLKHEVCAIEYSLKDLGIKELETQENIEDETVDEDLRNHDLNRLDLE